MKAGFSKRNTAIKMRTMKKSIFAIILLLCQTVLWAQGSISIESKVDKSTIYIGDVIQYSVILTHDPDVKVYMPELATNLGMFELRDYKVLDPQEEDGKTVSQTDYLLSTFDTGEYEIPELQIGYSTESDSTVRFIKTEPIMITIQSLNPEIDSDIRDIKPMRVPPMSYRQYIIIGGIVLLVLAAVFAAWYFYRRYKQGKSILPVRQAPPRPAHEVALEALNALVAGNLLEEKQFKAYYIELSDIVRHYIRNRFYIDAPEMTTSQLLDEMERQQLDTEYRDMMDTFLNGCDLVKFAKYVPQELETKNSTDLAFDFVEKTKMIIEEPISEEATEPVDEKPAELEADEEKQKELTEIDSSEPALEEPERKDGEEA